MKSSPNDRLRLAGRPWNRSVHWAFLAVAGALLTLTSEAAGQSLQGSQGSVDRQNAQAGAHDYTFLRTGPQVTRFVELGYLTRLRANANLELHAVSFAYARSEVRLFVERLASQYHSACGEKLVVTSLTRPLSEQPMNASEKSVHPTGMAVDLRRSTSRSCRTWLEQVLLQLEAKGVLEATYERNPPHYHIAVFPQPYARYVQARTGTSAILAAETPPSEAASPQSTVVRVATATTNDPPPETTSHRVRAGESLWTIARKYGVSETLLQAANGIRGSRILVGQTLTVPTSASGSGTLRYTVRNGDSLWVIANRLGTTVDEIRQRNGMDTTRIYAGQILDVPLTR